MAETVTNLKVRFGADTSKFKQDMDTGKAAVAGFTNQAGNAFSRFAELFGVNMAQVNAAMTAANRQATALTTGFRGAAAGSGILSGALKILRLALISTGIGALVVGLGSLISYFSKTQRGIDAVKRVMAAFSATVSVLVDRASLMGESIVNAFKNPKQAVTDLWNAIKNNIVKRLQAVASIFTGLKEIGAGTFNYIAASIKNVWSDQSQAIDEAKKQIQQGAGEIKDSFVQALTGLDSAQQQNLINSVKGLGAEIANEASAAYNLEAALQALEDREIALITVQEERRKKIEELRLAAKDETKSADERRKAITDAIAIEKQSLADEIALQKERVRILQEQTDLGESTRDDYRKLAEEQAKLSSLQSESARTLRTLQNEYNTLTNEIESNSEAIMKNRLKESGDMSTLSPVSGVQNLDTGLETSKLNDFVDANTAAANSILQTWTELSIGINEALVDVAVGFGEALGGIMNGTSGFKDIGAAVLSSLANIAINAGKIIAAAGIAFFKLGESFRLALTTPAAALAAVAAGVALIAIGSAVKGSLSNAASGGSSGGTFSSNSAVYDSSSGTSSLRGSSSSSSYAQTINVVVSGDFKLRGKDLVASVNKEQQVAKIRS